MALLNKLYAVAKELLLQRKTAKQFYFRYLNTCYGKR